MRIPVFALRASLLFLGCSESIFAAQAPAAVRTPPPKPAPAAANATDPAPLPPGKHTAEILAKLKLQNPKKEAAVQAAFVAFFSALAAWHKTNDANLKPLWADFNKARASHDDVRSKEALRRIDSIYVSFQPIHNSLLTNLRTVLTLDQIDTVEDLLTANKVKATYDAYQEIFPQLTFEQNEFILQNLKAAREDALNCITPTEKAAFFKKHKIKIEAYLTAQGYDVNKTYESYLAKQKADLEAKDTATPVKPKKN